MSMHEEIDKADFSSCLTKRIREAVLVLGKDAPFWGPAIHDHKIGFITRIQVHKSSGWIIRLTLDNGRQITHSCQTVTFEQQFSAKRFIEYVFERSVIFRGDLQYSKCVVDNHSNESDRPWFDD